ncbi:MAG: twin-arginine translocation signal domain-containing protein [Paracoccaceae bacterium]
MTKKTEGASRRDFLKLAGTAAPAAVAAVAVSGTQAEAAEPDLSLEKMQDTAHTRAYLDSTRF